MFGHRRDLFYFKPEIISVDQCDTILERLILAHKSFDFIFLALVLSGPA